MKEFIVGDIVRWSEDCGAFKLISFKRYLALQTSDQTLLLFAKKC